MGPLFKLLSGYYLVRALLKGPRYFTAFLTRRTLRRATNRQIRRIR